MNEKWRIRLGTDVTKDGSKVASGRVTRQGVEEEWKQIEKTKKISSISAS
jgi:hypothetical protein